MADLFESRVKAFRELRQSLQQLGEPTGLDAYRERLEIQREVNKEALLDAESMMAKLRMQSMIADEAYAQQEKAAARALAETEAESALAIAGLEKYDKKRGIFNQREFQPGEEFRFFRVFKKFEPKSLLDVATPRIQTIAMELRNVQKQEKAGIAGSGQRRQALMQEVIELQSDLSNSFVQEKMSKKADEGEKSLYNQYLAILSDAYSYLNK